jgi:glycosyltransferase involved in cell wall biosynthesis
MKILHVIPTLGCGGAEVLVANLAIQQVKAGHDVRIVILEPFHYTFENFISKDELLKLVIIEQISTKIYFSIFKKKAVLSNYEFNDIVLNFLPNIIHSHLFQAELVSRHTIFENVRYFTHCHNNMPQFNLFKKNNIKRYLTDFFELKWLLSKYKECENHFITISNNTKVYFEKKLPKKFKQSVNYLPNAINSSNYFNEKNRESSLFKLISVGNLLNNKGHLFLIDIVYELKKLNFNIQLDILGYGNMEKVIKAKIIELDLVDEVILRGSVNNVNEYLSKADIYIHGAFKEAFGLVFLEAMASELPVVTTNGGGNAELIIENYNGFLISNRSSEDFIDKVKYLIENKDARLKMGENAKKFSTKFDMVQMELNLSKLYDKF